MLFEDLELKRLSTTTLHRRTKKIDQNWFGSFCLLAEFMLYIFYFFVATEISLLVALKIMFLVPNEFWKKISEETPLLSCFSFTRSLRVKKKCKLSLGKKIETNLRKGHCNFAVKGCRFRCLVFGLPIITDSFHRTTNSFNISRNWADKSSVQVY